MAESKASALMPTAPAPAAPATSSPAPSAAPPAIASSSGTANENAHANGTSAGTSASAGASHSANDAAPGVSGSPAARAAAAAALASELAKPAIPVTSEVIAAAVAKTTKKRGGARGKRANKSLGAMMAAASVTTIAPATGAASMDAVMASAGGVPHAPVGSMGVPVAAPTHFNRLDESDLEKARGMGLLSETVVVSLDAGSTEYGIAYEKMGGSKVTGCGTDVFASQKALQERCKQFAMERGFQLVVCGSSSRPDGGGNVKYRCKKLNGQQFFDPNTPFEQLQCPFYVNGYGKGPAWKITRACFLHNHYKFIGSRLGVSPMVPDGEPGVGSVAGIGGLSLGGPGDSQPRLRAQRNTTLSTNVLCRMVNEELDKYPSSAVAMSKLDGKLIRRILLSRGHSINHMMASRIKRQIQLSRITSIRGSFQKLRSYFELIAEKNPGSQYKFEVDERGYFKRALFLPNATMQAFEHSQKVVSFDHIRPLVWRDEQHKSVQDDMDDESDDAISGVYLYACTKDHNDEVLMFALALVNAETQENWLWFLTALQDATVNKVNWHEFTVVSGRPHGFAEALQTVWPQITHRLCVRRIVDEEICVMKKIPLPEDKKQRVYDLSRAESEAEYKHIRQELALSNEAAVQFLEMLNRPSWVKFAFLEAFKKPSFGVVSADLSTPEENAMNALGMTKYSQMMNMGAIPSAMPSQLTTLQAWFGEEMVRSSQPLLTFSRYFMKIAENFHVRRKAVETRPAHELVPKRFAQLEQTLQGSQRCESVPCSNGTYMVRSLAQLSPIGHDSWRHVNLLDWECTCLEWQDRLFPCVHAIHAAELNRRRIDSLYDPKVFSVEHYKIAYSMGFTPWPLAAATLTANLDLKIPLDELYAYDPNTKRKPGPRPKAKRALSRP